MSRLVRRRPARPGPALRVSLPTGPEKEHAVRAMFDAIAPRYDALNRLMTFGLDRGWRRTAVHSLRLPPASVVLDVACGTGDLCRELARVGLRPVGFDVSSGMLAAAREPAPLVLGDGLQLPVATAVADGVTCGFALRNVVSLPRLFAEFARVLRPGGRVSILEVAEPTTPGIRAVHAIYFRRVVPVLGGLLSDRAAYRYLPRSTAYLPTVAEQLDLLQSAGFADVRSTPLGFGAVRLTTGTRR